MNYFSTDESSPRTAWCAVYDPETGEVVHVHEFIGFEISHENEHARALRGEAAIAHARQHTRKDAGNLSVAHGDPEDPPGIDDRLQFDLKKKKLVTTRGPLTLQDVEKLASKEQGAPDRPAVREKKPKKAR